MRFLDTNRFTGTLMVIILNDQKVSVRCCCSCICIIDFKVKIVVGYCEVLLINRVIFLIYDQFKNHNILKHLNHLINTVQKDLKQQWKIVKCLVSIFGLKNLNIWMSQAKHPLNILVTLLQWLSRQWTVWRWSKQRNDN